MLARSLAKSDTIKGVASAGVPEGNACLATPCEEVGDKECGRSEQHWTEEEFVTMAWQEKYPFHGLLVLLDGLAFAVFQDVTVGTVSVRRPAETIAVWKGMASNFISKRERSCTNGSRQQGSACSRTERYSGSDKHSRLSITQTDSCQVM